MINLHILPLLTIFSLKQPFLVVLAQFLVLVHLKSVELSGHLDLLGLCELIRVVAQVQFVHQQLKVTSSLVLKCVLEVNLDLSCFGKVVQLDLMQQCFHVVLARILLADGEELFLHLLLLENLDLIILLCQKLQQPLVVQL